MKYYTVGIAKEYGCFIHEYNFTTYEDAVKTFQKYNNFYFRAITEITCYKTKTKRNLLEKYINGKKVK